MILQEADLEFDFKNVVEAIKFDDETHGLSHCMKAVDFIVEEDDKIFFIEVKDPSDPTATQENKNKFVEKVKDNKLKDSLAKKLRDTFIYRFSENKISKPIFYLCLITLETPLVLTFSERLSHDIPIKSLPDRWTHKYIENCQALSLEVWKKSFPDWTVTRISEREQQAQ